MKSVRIIYTDDFVRELKKLPEDIVERATEKEQFFRKNPLHPSLRLHPLKGSLKGYWSLSITRTHRIVFSRKENGDILFLSIGKHDIYKSL